MLHRGIKAAAARTPTRQVEPGEGGCCRQHGQVAINSAGVQVQAAQAAGRTRHQLAQQAVAIGRQQGGAGQLELLQARQRAAARGNEFTALSRGRRMKPTAAACIGRWRRSHLAVTLCTYKNCTHSPCSAPDLQPYRLLGRVVGSAQRTVHHAELSQRGQRGRRMHLPACSGERVMPDA